MIKKIKQTLLLDGFKTLIRKIPFSELNEA